MASAHNLGVIYEHSPGLADLMVAVRWYRFAAERGHARAQANLGYLLREGRGVSQDLDEARSWLESRGFRAAGPAHASG